MNEKQVDIVFMSFYFTDVIFMVVDRLHEVTNHPFRILVGDNLSENSPEIRKKLRSYVEQGKISTAYFFDNNSRRNRLSMYKNESKPTYYVGSDQDALIEDTQDGCWLTDSIEMLESDNNVGITGLSSLNAPIVGRGPISTCDKKFQDTPCPQWKIFPHDHKKLSRKSNGWWPPFKGHLMTYKSEFMDKFCQTGNFFADDHIQDLITTKLGYSSARYEKTSVYNLGTIKVGHPVEGMDIPVDRGYIKFRRKISGLNPVPAGNFEIVRSGD
jgi:hypothetical protein